jgi:hypothetical protein
MESKKVELIEGESRIVASRARETSGMRGMGKG